MRSMREEGGKLIHEGERVLRRDVQNALNEGDFNMAVRRAQEGVELALKGALKLLGVDYPKAHDVATVFSEHVQRKCPSLRPGRHPFTLSETTVRRTGVEHFRTQSLS